MRRRSRREEVGGDDGEVARSKPRVAKVRSLVECDGGSVGGEVGEGQAGEDAGEGERGEVAGGGKKWNSERRKVEGRQMSGHSSLS